MSSRLFAHSSFTMFIVIRNVADRITADFHRYTQTDSRHAQRLSNDVPSNGEFEQFANTRLGSFINAKYKRFRSVHSAKFD